MRANTKKKHGMGKRFALVIGGVAAVGVMALGAQTVMAQTAAQPPAVVKYDTELAIFKERGRFRLFLGTVWSPHARGAGPANFFKECMNGRRVILFKQRPGADRKLGADRSAGGDPTIVSSRSGDWRVSAPKGALDHGDRTYAKVKRKVGDGFVCRADRSKTIVNGRI